MSNIGYVLAHVFALSGVPAVAQGSAELASADQARALAADRRVPGVLNVVFLRVGALAPNLNGYGTWTDFAIGVGVLFASILLFIFRRVVQDRRRSTA